MAKELPYFRFEPSEWDNGNIQICSSESKGLFIDLCSIYWSRLGELPYALALQKLCNGKEDALRELKNAEIFGVIDGQIVIEFLDEQLSERGQTSEKRRVAAKKRWSDASALQMQSKSNANRREEKRKEEKKIEENTQVRLTSESLVEESLKGLDEIYLDGQRVKWTHINFDFELNAFREKVRGSPDDYRDHDTNGIRKAFQYQLRNAKKNGTIFTDRKEERVNGLRAAFAKQVIDRSKGT